MPSLPLLEDPIADRGVVLRDAAERDIPEILIAHQDDPQLYGRLGLDRPPSGAELGREMEEAAGERRSGTRALLTILEQGFDKFRGRILVHNIDWENDRAGLGVWVVPEARGKGLARVALWLTAGWLFNSCRLARLELLIEPDNDPALRAAGAAGFVREGLLRGHARRGNGRQDMVILSLLATDFGAPGPDVPLRGVTSPPRG